jgi:DNA-binding GntR family transcriptional regulator
VKVSAFERYLIQEVNQHYRRSRQPVRTVVLADLLGKNDRTIREVLRRLESKGAVQRRGQRGGWLPA